MYKSANLISASRLWVHTILVPHSSARHISTATSRMRFADIAVNLADPMFEGSYHGKNKHPSDLDAVVARAREKGVWRMLITGTSLEDSRVALRLAERFGMRPAGLELTRSALYRRHPPYLDCVHTHRSRACRQAFRRP